MDISILIGSLLGLGIGLIGKILFDWLKNRNGNSIKYLEKKLDEINTCYKDLSKEQSMSYNKIVDSIHEIEINMQKNMNEQINRLEENFVQKDRLKDNLDNLDKRINRLEDKCIDFQKYMKG
jgi:uncharacterized coiled-coil DUF342 family protein